MVLNLKDKKMVKNSYLLVNNGTGGTGEQILAVCTSMKLAKMALEKALETGDYFDNRDCDQMDLYIHHPDYHKPNLSIIKREMNVIYY